MPLIIVGNAIWILLVVLGARLVTIGWRARSAAEAVLGAGIMLMAPGAGLLGMAIRTRHLPLGALAIALFGAGTLALPVFTYITFRRELPIARIAAAALVVLLVIGTSHQIAVIRATTAGEVHPSALFLAGRFLATSWAALEALRFRRMYVKRLALGLADPVIANRFLLYAVWTGVFAVMSITTLTTTIGGDALGIRWQTAVLKLMRLAGGVALGALYLNFVPPAAYLRWIEARHARSAP